MPRKAKEEKIIEEQIDTPKAKKATTTKKTTTKSATIAKKTITKKVATKKTVAKKPSSSKKKTITKKAATTKSTTTKPKKKIEVLEYYDLPYRYNQTVVKILAQTPNTMFVYWDISDEDKENYIKQYGEFFFNDTKPILIVHNKTKNKSFEVDINDYANSWYLHLLDSNCNYTVELGRRPINEYAKINDYMHISSSNNIDSPNDHILFDTLSKTVYFKNIKTNVVTSKDISLSFLTKIGKLYNVNEFYEKLYPNENIKLGKIGYMSSSNY